jgi:catechol-2,3-dioxygenase
LQVGSFADLQECYRTLKAHNVTITRTIYHLITKSIYFVDLDGNEFELYCNDGDNALERLRRGEASASTRLNLGRPQFGSAPNTYGSSDDCASTRNLSHWRPP